MPPLSYLMLVRTSPCSIHKLSINRTGLAYLVNRYYDPATDQFLSVDADVQQTDQPYVFTDDNPLNLGDPLGVIACDQNECTTGFSTSISVGPIITVAPGVVITTSATASTVGKNSTSLTLWECQVNLAPPCAFKLAPPREEKASRNLTG